ncbi:MAG: hypothetical protein CVU00_07155 [Bacteroidetes bacterium HGW-Bacteroidetes-17]|jgi:hypothetical protein|nr:MAG: hypothetical protein CVU00_07155 [Bacteroidetes bacterium HGW-Bacteroidetes-17]
MSFIVKNFLTLLLSVKLVFFAACHEYYAWLFNLPSHSASADLFANMAGEMTWLSSPELAPEERV